MTTETKAAEPVQQTAPPAPPAFEYRPPIESICPSCGGKCIGACSFNSCSDYRGN